MYSNMQCTVNVPNTWKEQKIARAGQKERYYAFGIFVAVITVLTIGLILFPSFAAADYVSDITDILGSMIDIVGTIFQAVGVILAVYAVGCVILLPQRKQRRTRRLSAPAVRAIAQKVPHEHRHQGDRQQDKRRKQRDVQHHDASHKLPPSERF